MGSYHIQPTTQEQASNQPTTHSWGQCWPHQCTFSQSSFPSQSLTHLTTYLTDSLAMTPHGTMNMYQRQPPHLHQHQTHVLHFDVDFCLRSLHPSSHPSVCPSIYSYCTNFVCGTHLSLEILLLRKMFRFSVWYLVGVSPSIVKITMICVAV